MTETAASLEQVVQEIAAQLGETALVPRAQIRRIVERLGATVAQAFVAQALAVEAAGGMLLPDGSRRRTLGGVFFLLVRQHSDAATRRAIFPPTGKRPRGTGSSPSAAALPPFAWADRLAVVQEIGQHKGEARTVKVTLIGRPGKVVEKQDLVLMVMQSGKAPSLPKGLPAPPATPTTYTVYIARKQWNGVAQAIKNAEDALIIEGWAAYDPDLEGIAVFATNTTTKLLQAAKRQQQATAG